MQHTNQFMLDLVKQALEQLESFFLVFLLGVFLGVAAQVDALAQVIHARQVLFPVAIQNLQHQVLLDLAQILGTDLSFLTLVILVHALDQLFNQALDMQLIVFVEPLANRCMALEFRVQGFLQARDIPLIFHRARRHVIVDHFGHHIATNPFHGIYQIIGFQNLVTLAVDDLTLVVGNVIVFQQVLADIKVAPFHLALGIFDGASYPAVLNGFAVFQAQRAHQVTNLV